MKIPQFPALDKISLLTSTIMLAFTASRYVVFTPRYFSTFVFGLLLEIEVDTQFLVSIIVMGLAVTGSDWLIRDHVLNKHQSTIHHWFLPGFSALGIGIILNQIPFGLLWWGVFLIGALLLIMVWVAEYIVVDPTDMYFIEAFSGLTALSFVLYFIFTITLRSFGTRLLINTPVLGFTAGLICMRTLYLRLQMHHLRTAENVQNALFAAATTTIVQIQVLSFMHFMNISLISFGIAVLGSGYSIISFFGNLVENKTYLKALIEPVIIIIVVLLLLLWFN